LDRFVDWPKKRAQIFAFSLPDSSLPIFLLGFLCRDQNVKRKLFSLTAPSFLSSGTPAISVAGFDDFGVRKFIRALIVAGNSAQNFKELPTKS